MLPEWFFDLRSSEAGTDWLSVTSMVYSLVWRSNLQKPGFALLRLGRELDSFRFRRMMVEFQQSLSSIHQSRVGRPLVFRSLARFNQQVTTRFHLDGGPDRSILLLGYEPSSIPSRLAIADYTRCAYELGITPREFLDRFNLKYQSTEMLLSNYVTVISHFEPSEYQLLLINNSSRPYPNSDTDGLGVLHQAEILATNPGQARVINSSMLIELEPSELAPVSSAELQSFLDSTSVY